MIKSNLFKRRGEEKELPCAVLELALYDGFFVKKDMVFLYEAERSLDRNIDNFYPANNKEDILYV